MSRLNGIFCRSDLRFARNQGKKCRLTPAFLFREYTRNSQAMSNTSSARHYQDLISFVKSKDNKLQDRIRHPDRMVNAVAENELRQYRSAAVLIPVTRLNAEAESCVILTVRSADLNSHPGQISFPGGTAEKQDKDPVATALRETQEEIGLHPNNVEVIGRISDIALPSGYRVTPVVGIIDNDLYGPRYRQTLSIAQ